MHSHLGRTCMYGFGAQKIVLSIIVVSNYCTVFKTNRK